MADQGLVWINGKMEPWENANVHLFSHALSRGSAVFEVFGFHDIDGQAKAFRLDLHLKRLQKTCELLGMKLAQTKEELAQAVKETIKTNGYKMGWIKMIGYWSGEAFTSLVPTAPLDMAVFAIPAGPDDTADMEKPLTACVSKWCKLHPRTVPVSAKVAAHYLNGMMARRDAMERGFDMGIMMDTQGFMAEGSIESVFIVKDGVLKTAVLGRVLASVSRQSVLDVARAIGIEAQETGITLEELLDADEAFISATPYKARVIKKLEDKELPNPGPVTAKLHDALQKILAGQDERFTGWFEPLE